LARVVKLIDLFWDLIKIDPKLIIPQ
jgi:hypothetical protein